MSFFIAAYLVVWLVTFAYLFSIHRRQLAVNRSLQKLLSEKGEQVS